MIEIDINKLLKVKIVGTYQPPKEEQKEVEETKKE